MCCPVSEGSVELCLGGAGRRRGSVERAAVVCRSQPRRAVVDIAAPSIIITNHTHTHATHSTPDGGIEVIQKCTQMS